MGAKFFVIWVLAMGVIGAIVSTACLLVAAVDAKGMRKVFYVVLAAIVFSFVVAVMIYTNGFTNGR